MNALETYWKLAVSNSTPKMMDPYSENIDLLYTRVQKELEVAKPNFTTVKLMLSSVRRLVEFRDEYNNFCESLLLDLSVD